MGKELSLIAKIKKLVSLADIELEELTLPDGTVIYAEAFATGEAVFVQNEEGERLPLPVGEYVLEDGRTIVVSEEGVIAEVLEAGGEPAGGEEELTAETQEAILKTFKQMQKQIADMKAENANLKKEKADLSKVELSKAGKKKGITVNAEGQKVEVRLPVNPRFMSQSERINMAMQNTPFYRKAVNLATTVDITTTYAGQFAGEYIRAATLQGVTLGSGAVTIKENIKLKEVVKRVATTDILADASCAFTSTGDVTIDERILEPKELQVNLELCKSDFSTDWDAVSMGYSAFDTLPPTFQAFFAEQVAAIVNEAIEVNIYQGDGDNAGEFDGLDLLLAADAAVVDVDNTGVTIDETTVIAELGRVADAIPQSIYNTEDLVILVAPNVGRAYMRALGGFGAAGLGGSGYMGQGPTGPKPLNFDGVPLFIGNGMTAGTMIACQKRNVWFGTGVLNDANEVKILDMADLDGSKNVRFIMRFTAGVQFGVGAEIVYYWTEV